MINLAYNCILCQLLILLNTGINGVATASMLAGTKGFKQLTPVLPVEHDHNIELNRGYNDRKLKRPRAEKVYKKNLNQMLRYKSRHAHVIHELSSPMHIATVNRYIIYF